MNSQKWPSHNNKMFKGIPGQIVKAIAPHTEADSMALLSQLLVTFGNYVGRGPYFRTEADQQKANLFIVNIGQTAKGRKGSSWGYIQKLFQSFDYEWVCQNVRNGLASGEGLISILRDDDQEAPTNFQPQILKDKRLLICDSEFASTLKVVNKEHNTLSPVLRNAWDGKVLHNMSKGSPGKASEAHLSIIGHITRIELQGHLRQTEIANGLGNRFLFFCVQRSKELPHGGDLDPEDFTLMFKEIQESVRAASNVTEMVRDLQARELWEHVYSDLSRGRPGVAGSLSSRSEAQVMRLALVLSLFDRKKVIDREALETALEIHEYCLSSLNYIFGERLGHDTADSILQRLLESPSGLTRTQIREIFKNNRNSDLIEDALQLLSESALASKKMVPTNGRSVELWTATQHVQSETFEQFPEINDRSPPADPLSSFLESEGRS